MKKVITLICILVLAGALLCACDNGDLGKHVDSFSSEWEYNATEHFHKCSGCDETKDNAAHTFENGKCTECGYENSDDPSNPTEHEHHFSSEWSYSETEHFHKCSGCDETKDNAAHTYDEDDICTVCGYKKGGSVEPENPSDPSEHEHTLKHMDAKEATCTEDGNIEYWQCGECNKYFRDSEARQEIQQDETIIPAGHKFPEEYEYDDAEHWRKCENCTTEERNAHDFGEDNICKVCGFELHIEPTLGVIIIIDYSPSKVAGSVDDMNRLDYALAAAIYIIEHLDDSDFVGIIRFADWPELSLPMSQVDEVRENVREIFDSFGEIIANGTSFSPALKDAGQALENLEVDRRHIIVITDGEPAEPLYNDGSSLYPYGSVIESNFDHANITTSIIHMGNHGSVNMKTAAEDLGHGNYINIYEKELDSILERVQDELSWLEDTIALEPSEHTHSFSTDWSYNETEHFHKCSGCNETKDNAAHTFDDDGVCTECGYFEHEHNFSTEWSYNAEEHFHKCDGCDEVTDKAAHTFEYGVCTVCEYERIPSEGLKYSLNDDRKSYSVVGIGTCEDLQIIIPEIYLGYPVTSIGESAFMECTNVDIVVIGDSVTSICDYAFMECTNLFRVVIGKNVTSIGKSAFHSCDIFSVEIPDSVMSIGDEAFSDCDGLQSVVIGNGVTRMGKSVFNSCAGLQSVEIEDGVTSIGESAFMSCGNLRSVEIPDSVMSIGDEAFKYCHELQSVEIPDSVTSIGNEAFCYCQKLKSVVIGDGVTSIGERAFAGCVHVQNIVIPDSVTSIGIYAFSDCYKLIEICNNSSLEIQMGSEENGMIGYYAKNIYSDEEGGSKIVDYQGYSFYIDEETNERYLLCYNGDETSITLPAKYEGNDYEIYNYAFYRSANLQSVVIGYGVTSIGDYAFDDCDSLQRVYYYGTEEEWEHIDKFENDFLNVTIYYYSENDPKDSSDYNEENNYWHYDGDNGEIAVWEKKQA